MLAYRQLESVFSYCLVTGLVLSLTPWFYGKWEYFIFSFLSLFCYLRWCLAGIPCQFHRQYFPVCFHRVQLNQTASFPHRKWISTLQSPNPPPKATCLGATLFYLVLLVREECSLTRSYMDGSCLSQEELLFWRQQSYLAFGPVGELPVKFLILISEPLELC